MTINFGILAALVANVLLPALQWRTMFGLAVVPAIALAFGLLACPESPRWLASQGHKPAAEAAAVRLWGPGGLSQLSVGEAGAGDSDKEVGFASLLAPQYIRCVAGWCQVPSGVLSRFNS